jgi:hypothetical protein
VPLGESGLYPFEALAALAAVAPEDVWAALRAAARPGESRR